MLGTQSLAGDCGPGLCGRGGLSRGQPWSVCTPPRASVLMSAVAAVILGTQGCCSDHKRRQLEGLTCRCSVNVFIFSFEVFFVISEEDKSCHFDYWLLPPQSFPVLPSMVTPGPSAELSPSPLSTRGSWHRGSKSSSWPSPRPPRAPACSGGRACMGHSYTSLRTLQPAHPTPAQRWGRERNGVESGGGSSCWAPTMGRTTGLETWPRDPTGHAEAQVQSLFSESAPLTREVHPRLQNKLCSLNSYAEAVIPSQSVTA